MRITPCLVPLTLAFSLALAGCEVELPVAGTTLRFDPEMEGGFYSLPMPNDARRLPGADGSLRHPDFTQLPNPGDSEQLSEYLNFLATEVQGFGTNSATWFAFGGALEEPAWDLAKAEASARCEGSVRIVNVDPESPRLGECLPAQVRLVGKDSVDPYVVPNLLVIAPWWGFPMDGATTYAVVVVDQVTEERARVESDADLLLLLEGTSEEGDLQSAYQPLVDFLDAHPDWLGHDRRARISAATVFTTLEPTGELRALVESVQAEPTLPEWNVDEGLQLLESADGDAAAGFDIYGGSYRALNFQSGEIPYSDEGGGFVFEQGVPQAQWEEDIPFAIGMPNPVFEQPEEGWPVLIHAHGTGGDQLSHISGGSASPAKFAASRGFLSIGIPQPIHGERWPEGSDVAVSLYSFNYFNPHSGISMFRQGALDTISLIRFVQEQMGPEGALSAAHPGLRIDPSRLHFLGHSQGGITGAMILPFADAISSWVISGAGAGVSMTLMQREDPIVIRDAMLTALGAPESTELFDLHPLVGIVQTIVEPSDPMNYAPLWLARSEGSPKSILLTEGIHDAQTPADTAEALAVAGRVPLAEPFHERDIPGLTLRGLEPIETPFSGNVDHPAGQPVTFGLAQFDAAHWAIFNDSSARELYANFLWSQLRDGPPGELGGDFP